MVPCPAIPIQSQANQLVQASEMLRLGGTIRVEGDASMVKNFWQIIHTYRFSKLHVQHFYGMQRPIS